MLPQERNICSNTGTEFGEAPYERHQAVMGWTEEDAAPAELAEINLDRCYKDVAPTGYSRAAVRQIPTGFRMSNAGTGASETGSCFTVS
jgi:hypothetical protein